MDTSSFQNRTRLPNYFITVCALGALTFPVSIWAGPSGTDTNRAAAIAARLDDILVPKKNSKTVFGGCVIELPSGRVIYDRESHRPLIPASNMKMVVMAAAIDALGSKFAFTTTLATCGPDLVVIGGGDPTFGDEKLCRRRGEAITGVFRKWAADLKAAGVKRISGNLIIDDSIFDSQFVHSGWPADQYQAWYEAPIGGLNFNSNCIDVILRPTKAGKPASASLLPGNDFVRLVNKTVTGKKQAVAIRRPRDSDTIVVSQSVAREVKLGPTTVRDPGMYFGHVLKNVLEAQGIAVDGHVVRRKARKSECKIIATHRAPLSDCLARAGKDSLGMMAESLIKAMGAHCGSAGSWTCGRGAVQAYLKKVGVDPKEVVVDDGSGLSRNNRLSPAAATRILQYVSTAPNSQFEILRNSLSKAGIDGTLDDRMRSPDVRGRVFAKTGYIAGVRTLAGYIHTQSGQWLAFAFFYNQAAATKPLSKAQDEACRFLVNCPITQTEK